MNLWVKVKNFAKFIGFIFALLKKVKIKGVIRRKKIIEIEHR